MKPAPRVQVDTGINKENLNVKNDQTKIIV